MDYQLKCFDPAAYIPFFEIEIHPEQCIAPNKWGNRCGARILLSETLKVAANLRRQAKRLSDTIDVYSIVKQYVLLRCCEDLHKEKLEADETGCLDSIVRRYIQEIKEDARRKKEAAQGRNVLLRTSAAEVASLVETASSQPNSRYDLRPECRPSATLRKLTPLQKKTSIFVPYKSGPKDNIRNDIQADVPCHFAENGEVYILIWPAHPGFLKIGYSSKSAETRRDALQDCHPGLVVQQKIRVPYPERMERLIHLEMAPHRRKIIICQNCRKTHHEWFEIGVPAAAHVFSSWFSLIQREPIYDSSRSLTPQWRERLRSFGGNTITAQVLLDLLDAEAVSNPPLHGPPARPELCEQKTMADTEIVSCLEKISTNSTDDDQVLTFFKDFMRMLASIEVLDTPRSPACIRPSVAPLNVELATMVTAAG